MARPKFKYTIPAESRLSDADPRTIALQPITLGEEAQALKSGSNTLAYELLKYALVEVDDKPITWENSAKEKFLEQVSPGVRQLLLIAYDQIHNPSDAVKRDFFASRAVAV